MNIFLNFSPNHLVNTQHIESIRYDKNDDNTYDIKLICKGSYNTYSFSVDSEIKAKQTLKYYAEKLGTSYDFDISDEDEEEENETPQEPKKMNPMIKRLLDSLSDTNTP